MQKELFDVKFLADPNVKELPNVRSLDILELLDVRPPDVLELLTQNLQKISGFSHSSDSEKSIIAGAEIGEKTKKNRRRCKLKLARIKDEMRLQSIQRQKEAEDRNKDPEYIKQRRPHTATPIRNEPPADDIDDDVFITRSPPTSDEDSPDNNHKHSKLQLLATSAYHLPSPLHE
uniref:Uncharacterized protein n=1 Tax=Rhizophagus irregularis (strain DAOM 181602 / DAOM 197198 / MUCL 43194) TaxID=747089 RepID=U9STA1_RHIID